VTYVVREGGTDLFTVEQMQLEAYCSAIGKILLAALPDAGLAAHRDQGPFVALTPNTITHPALLGQELLGVRDSWVAHDRHEVRSDLYCIAVPLRRRPVRCAAPCRCPFPGASPTPPPNGARRGAQGSRQPVAAPAGVANICGAMSDVPRRPGARNDRDNGAPRPAKMSNTVSLSLSRLRLTLQRRHPDV